MTRGYDYCPDPEVEQWRAYADEATERFEKARRQYVEDLQLALHELAHLEVYS